MLARILFSTFSALAILSGVAMLLLMPVDAIATTCAFIGMIAMFALAGIAFLNIQTIPAR